MGGGGGGVSMVNLVTFHSFEARNDAFEVEFSGLQFYTLSKTLIINLFF